MAEKADHVGKQAPYLEIADHYREEIESGRLQPGMMLPSYVNMAKQHQVSPGTAEKAVRTLRESGWVRGIHGLGTEVIGPPAPLSSGSQRQDRGNRTGSSWGSGERSDSHTAKTVPAPKEVAAALGLRPKDKVIRRTRVYRDGHGIVAHSTSWIPTEFAKAVPALLRGERLKGGTSLDLISRKTGRSPATRDDRTSARIATPDDIALLGLEAGTVAAILVLSTLFLDAEGRVLEYGVDLGAPGRTRHEVSETL